MFTGISDVNYLQKLLKLFYFNLLNILVFMEKRKKNEKY